MAGLMSLGHVYAGSGIDIAAMGRTRSLAPHHAVLPADAETASRLMTLREHMAPQ